MQRLKSGFFGFGVSILLSSCAHHASYSGEKIPAEAQAASLELTPESVAKEKKGSWVRVAFSSRVGGEVAQCGCSVNPKGGVDRRLNFLRAEKKASDSPLLVVDAGNALFPAELLDRGQAEFQRRRAQGIFKAHALMGVVAQNVGYLDVTAGLDFLRNQAAEAKVPLVSTNLLTSDGKPAFQSRIRVPLPEGGFVSVLGLSAGSRFADVGLTVADPQMSLKSALKEIPEEELVIVLSDLGQVLDEEVSGQLSRPTVWIGSRDLNSLESPLHRGKALLVRAQIQGQQWGLVSLAWNPSAQGWFNPSLAKVYWQRWAALPTDERNEAETEFSYYIGGQTQNKIVYQYHLVNMSLEYGEPNELTTMTRDLGKAP